MRSVYRPSTIADQKQILDLLVRVLSSRREPFVADPVLMQWKYWAPRPDCLEPRSFVAESSGRIVAHVGLWPVTVISSRTTCQNGDQTGDRTSERGVHMMDWASEPSHPGAGLALLQRASADYNFVYSIGGSQVTQSILPVFGFLPVGEALTWARPIRPWRQAGRPSDQKWRVPLRMARNLFWSLYPAGSTPTGWAAIEADRDEDVEDSCERDAHFFSYLRQCPAIQCRRFFVRQGGRNAGHFALVIAGSQARLAGVWLENPSAAAWSIAFHLAQEAALRHTDACELTARCATPASAEAAVQAGMRIRKRSAVLLFRKDRDPELPPLQYQLVDNDAIFHFPAAPGPLI